MHAINLLSRITGWHCLRAILHRCNRAYLSCPLAGLSYALEHSPARSESARATMMGGHTLSELISAKSQVKGVWGKKRCFVCSCCIPLPYVGIFSILEHVCG